MAPPCPVTLWPHDIQYTPGTCQDGGALDGFAGSGPRSARARRHFNRAGMAHRFMAHRFMAHRFMAHRFMAHRLTTARSTAAKPHWRAPAAITLAAIAALAALTSGTAS